MHAVAAARVQVAIGVDVDAIRHTGCDEGEGLAVGEGAVLFDIIAVAWSKDVSAIMNFRPREDGDTHMLDGKDELRPKKPWMTPVSVT